MAHLAHNSKLPFTSLALAGCHIYDLHILYVNNSLKDPIGLGIMKPFFKRGQCASLQEFKKLALDHAVHKW